MSDGNGNGNDDGRQGGRGFESRGSSSRGFGRRDSRDRSRSPLSRSGNGHEARRPTGDGSYNSRRPGSGGGYDGRRPSDGGSSYDRRPGSGGGFEGRGFESRRPSDGGSFDSRRPGERSPINYPRPSGSRGPPRDSYSGSPQYRSEQSTDSRGSFEQRPPSRAFSDTASVASETTSVAGSDVKPVGRGAMSGRRILPAADTITRPRDLVSKQGKFGQPVMLQANYFKLLKTTEWCLYQYAVEFSPDEDRTGVRLGLLRQCKDQIGSYIFDGAVLYTSQRLPDPLELHAERKNDSQMMSMTIKKTADLNRGDYQYIQVFNIIMRKCLNSLDLRLVGRNFFDPQNKVQIHEWKLELWPGYVTAIRQHEQDILLCSEITHKVMRMETVLDIIKDCIENNSQTWRETFQKQVVDSVVLTGYNNNTYKISDVDFNVNPESTFQKKNGEIISYCDYYSTKYQITIRDRRQPLLVTRSKSRDRRADKSEDKLVYLIPELCNSTGMTDNMRTNFRLMSALAQHTRVNPGNRINKLMKFNERLHRTPNVAEELAKWNLQLDRRLVDIPARILPAEKIIYANNKFSSGGERANWTNDFRNQSLFLSAHLSEWAIVVPKRCMRECESFVNTLIKVAKNMGFNIEQPYVYNINGDQITEYNEVLDRIKSERNPMLIFCVATNNRVDRYSAIKKKCCVQRPVPTQVLLSKNLQGKSQMSIATKVAIQMNCKVGGTPWVVSIPLTGLMVVGYDVCREKQAKDNSFGAMVASLDANFGRYYSAVTKVQFGEEISNDISNNLCQALIKFKTFNNAYPKRIVVYRDGVGDGQINTVVNHEVKLIKERLAELYGSPDEVKLAFIIVTKKINTRLFLNKHNRPENPPAGTIVDDVITDPSKYDFFIVPQHVNQGTVSPTSYNVVEDTSGLDVDKIQRLTYKLCHMYFNWSGTVRVPAPVQYAHKLAFLVSQSIHAQPDEVLNNLLYFL